MGLWILMALIVGTIYRSNLKAMLIIPKLKLPFDSMEELIESGLPTAVIQGTSVHMDVVVSTSVLSSYFHHSFYVSQCYIYIFLCIDLFTYLPTYLLIFQFIHAYSICPFTYSFLYLPVSFYPYISVQLQN